VGVSKSRALSVDGTYLPDHTRPFLRMSLGPFQEWTGPVASESARALGEFAFGHEVDFVAQDVNTDLVVEVRQKNVLSADALIGQIVVPLTNILPRVRDVVNGSHPRDAPYVLQGWFEVRWPVPAAARGLTAAAAAAAAPQMFPLAGGRRKFRPAASDIANTGMPRPDVPLGFVRLRLELHLHGRISLWAGYALPRFETVLGPAQPPLPTGDLKAISEIIETGRGFKRNFQRVKRGFARLTSRGDSAWVPTRFFRIARTWEVGVRPAAGASHALPLVAC
jgi:hypothetical protein